MNQKTSYVSFISIFECCDPSGSSGKLPVGVRRQQREQTPAFEETVVVIIKSYEDFVKIHVVVVIS